MTEDIKDQLIAALEEENDVLRARVSDLEATLGLTLQAPVAFGLTDKEARIFGFLLARELLTKEAAMSLLYGALPDADKLPEIKIVDVFICKLRKKVQRFGLSVATKWGQGYYLTPAMKVKARELMAQSRSEDAA